MTEQNRNQIYELRKQGYGYKRIASLLELPVATVKTFLIRNPTQEATICKNCGAQLINKPKRKKRVFCCNKCKMQYWNNHHKLSDSQKSVISKCECCGKEFYSYKSKSKKFCSRECYLKTVGGKNGSN